MRNKRVMLCDYSNLAIVIFRTVLGTLRNLEVFRLKAEENCRCGASHPELVDIVIVFSLKCKTAFREESDSGLDLVTN